jgi:hypothetical protein
MADKTQFADPPREPEIRANLEGLRDGCRLIKKHLGNGDLESIRRLKTAYPTMKDILKGIDLLEKQTLKALDGTGTKDKRGPRTDDALNTLILISYSSSTNFANW